VAPIWKKLVSAALRPGSVPYQALAEAFGRGDVCASEETLAELERGGGIFGAIRAGEQLFKATARFIDGIG